MIRDLGITNFTKDRIKQIPVLSLAYIGDGVYELYVRTFLLSKKNLKSGEVHKKAIKYVCAGAQANIAKQLYEGLTETEKSVFRRGKNAKATSVPKNANLLDYRLATAFETLVGYIYLMNDMKRLKEILINSIEIAENKQKKRG